MSKVNTVLSVTFGAGDGNLGLRIEEDRVTDGEGFVSPTLVNFSNLTVRLRQYPAVRVNLVATIGEAEYLYRKSQEIVRESIKFSGSSTASTQYPVVGGVTIEDIDQKFDNEGNKISEQLGYAIDPDGSIRASKAFSGAIYISYTTEYYLIEYTYLTETLLGGIGGAQVVGTTIKGGEVLAINKGEVASHEVGQPGLPEEADYTELYLVFSESIVNEEGEWEKPVGWTGEDDSPTWPGGQPDPGESFVEKERVHEIGYVDTRGRVFKRKQIVRAADPKTFDSSYKIPKKLKITDDNQLSSFGLSDAKISQAKQHIPDPSTL